MKIERKPAQFQPVIITLETKEEVDTMCAAMRAAQSCAQYQNHTINDLHYQLHVIFNKSTCNRNENS
jgi:hypothetical protein